MIDVSSIGDFAAVGIHVAVGLEFVIYMVFFRALYPWREAVISLPYFLISFSFFNPRGLFNDVGPNLVGSGLQVWHIETNTFARVVLLFVIVDLAHYAFHRVSHRCHLLWVAHSVHHSIAAFTIFNGVRIGMTEWLFGGWLFFLPLVALGFDVPSIFSMYALNLFLQGLIHTTFVPRLRPLGWMFNTPSHHLIHHAADSAYFDRNFGGVLIIWDRLFGTFGEARPGIEVALAKPRESHALRTLIALECEPYVRMFRAAWLARGWQARIWAVLGPPAFAEKILESPRAAAASRVRASVPALP